MRHYQIQCLYLIISMTILTSCHRISTRNNCEYTIDVGTNFWDQGASKVIPENGGYRLLPNATHSFSVPQNWIGRVWGRTGCDKKGSGCATGYCGPNIECAGNDSVNPQETLAEFALHQGRFGVSIIDGFNIPIAVDPIRISGNEAGDSRCKRAICGEDLNANCPKELQVIANNKVVACKSSWKHFNTSQACVNLGGINCTGHEYENHFREGCPGAYHFAMHRWTNQSICPGENNCYMLTFCPSRSESLPLGSLPPELQFCEAPLEADLSLISTKILIAVSASIISLLLITSIVVIVYMKRRPLHGKQRVRYEQFCDLFRNLNYDSRWELDVKKLTRGRVIDSGHNGKVYLSTYKSEGAVEILIAEKVVLAKRQLLQVDALFNELQLMMKMGEHINVIKFMGTVTSRISNGELSLCTEFCEFGNLMKYLQVNQIDDKQKLDFCTQIANGMVFMSRGGLVHRDLAARNIFVTRDHDSEGDLMLKIADFGLAINVNDDHTKYILGDMPQYWSAPEAVTNPTSKSDVWSFGVTMYEIFRDGKQITKNIARDENLKDNEEWPEGVFNIMKSCWLIDPEQRPNFETLKGSFLRLRSSSVNSTDSGICTIEMSAYEDSCDSSSEGSYVC